MTPGGRPVSSADFAVIQYDPPRIRTVVRQIRNRGAPRWAREMHLSYCAVAAQMAAIGRAWTSRKPHEMCQPVATPVRVASGLITGRSIRRAWLIECNKVVSTQGSAALSWPVYISSNTSKQPEHRSRLGCAIQGLQGSKRELFLCDHG